MLLKTFPESNDLPFIRSVPVEVSNTTDPDKLISQSQFASIQILGLSELTLTRNERVTSGIRAELFVCGTPLIKELDIGINHDMD